MDYTETALRCMPLRELDVVFAEMICRLRILDRNPFDLPGFVLEQLPCVRALTSIPPLCGSRAASPYVIESVERRGFTHVRTVSDSCYRCRIYKNGLELSDVSLPNRGNVMRVLMVAAILAAQVLHG